MVLGVPILKHFGVVSNALYWRISFTKQAWGLQRQKKQNKKNMLNRVFYQQIEIASKIFRHFHDDIIFHSKFCPLSQADTLK